MSSQPPAPDKWSRRKAAGGFKLEGGTGSITAMCGCKNFLEIYKKDATFRVRTPESVDPGKTNPDAPWVASMVDTVGSSSKVVARVFIQASDMFKIAMFDESIDKDEVICLLHECKESLVICEKAADRIAGQIDAIVEKITKGELGSGRMLNPFPQVSELQGDATSYLISAKRAIRCVCELPSLFLGLPKKDNNFDNLGKRLEKSAGVSANVTKFVLANAQGVRHLIELRNYQEHPGKKKTVITNFDVLPNSMIRAPVWHVSGKEPLDLRTELRGSLDFLVRVAEEMTIHLIMAKMSKKFPFVILRNADEEIDPANPIKYELSIDVGQLKMTPTT